MRGSVSRVLDESDANVLHSVLRQATEPRYFAYMIECLPRQDILSMFREQLPATSSILDSTGCRGVKGDTVLHTATRKPDSRFVAIIKNQLSDWEFNDLLCITNSRGESPLHRLIPYVSFRATLQLAFVDEINLRDVFDLLCQQDNHKDNVLHVAARIHPDLLECMLDFLGGKRFFTLFVVRNALMQTPLHVLVSHNHSSLSSFLQKMSHSLLMRSKIVKCLLSQDPAGICPSVLNMAVKQSNERVLISLLSCLNSQDCVFNLLSMPDRSKESPITLAICQPDLHMFKCMLNLHVLSGNELREMIFDMRLDEGTVRKAFLDRMETSLKSKPSRSILDIFSQQLSTFKLG